MAARISVTAEVLGTGSDGTEPSVIFSVQRHGVYSADVTLLKRYLFNCGEGTQRLCGENGVKLGSLDSVFFTRFDVEAVSGVPGLIFSLSTCGSANLRLHGPVGLRGFLVAIQSFVRRKYPRITCVETGAVCGSEGEAGGEPQRRYSEDAHEPQANFDFESWGAEADQSDQHMRILPVVLNARLVREESALGATASTSNACVLCQHGDTVERRNAIPAPARGDQAPSSLVQAQEGEDADAEFRAWLLCFYAAKVPEKVPYVDVILNRFRGRHADLKAQLCAKYGALELGESESESGKHGADREPSDSSSSDLSDDSDNAGSDAPDDLRELSMSREWLLKFYRQHQPEKLLHVDKVLKQFSGREDTLKGMLLTKYCSSPSTGAARVQHEKPSKRRRPPSDSASASSRAAPASLCYVMKFQHDLHSTVWVIDCRTADHVADLVAQLQAGACVDHAPVLVVHFSPLPVLLDSRYQCWMQTLGTAQQLVFDGRSLQTAASGVFGWVFRASATHTLEQQQQRPVVGSADAAQRWSRLSAFLSEQQALGPKESYRAGRCRVLWRLGSSGTDVHVAQSRQRFELLRGSSGRVKCDFGRTGWRRCEEPSAEDAPASPSDLQRPEASAASEPTEPTTANEDVLKLVVLGTGSAAPSKLRGSTAMYLEFPGARSPPTSLVGTESARRTPDAMLIDCGEGTFGQLWRQFGDETAARIGALSCVWISHSHADHQCGLIRVLSEFVRYHASVAAPLDHAPLVVIAPLSVISYARSWMRQIADSDGAAGRTVRVAFATCREFNDRRHPLRAALLARIETVVAQLSSVPVHHCYDSYGLVLELRDGRKVVYSGDTRPCDALVAAGTPAALLIHEATFDDALASDAVSKRHSTVGEALEVARQMRAREVVLTHFSQRYPKLPPPLATAAPESARRETPSTALPLVRCAFDGYVHYV
ncbi:hypothetical protein PybrP1_004719 [[Pythium] brassicae (nom. inval.)]|nr:hypothetical protein PybrP1_004719 [[Pythium] brassicae (nom. inval.)]